MNGHPPLADYQESRHSLYTLQLAEAPFLDAYDRPSIFNSPTSPCTSLSSIHWSDSEPSPKSPQHHLDDTGTSTSTSSELSSALSVPPSVPQTAPPARAQQSFEAPGPRRPSIAPPAPDSTPRDIVGRRPAAPKQRRVTRAVQPLACYFCRGRKIACGPPANLGSGDRTCEYVVTRTLLFPKTLLVTLFSLRAQPQIHACHQNIYIVHICAFHFPLLFPLLLIMTFATPTPPSPSLSFTLLVSLCLCTDDS
jgi:hypothetical protein